MKGSVFHNQKSVKKILLIGLLFILILAAILAGVSKCSGSSSTTSSSNLPGAGTVASSSGSSSEDSSSERGHYIHFHTGANSSEDVPSPIFVPEGGSVTITFDEYPSYEGEGEKFFVGWSTHNKSDYIYDDIVYGVNDEVTINALDGDVELYPVFLRRFTITYFSDTVNGDVWYYEGQLFDLFDLGGSFLGWSLNEDRSTLDYNIHAGENRIRATRSLVLYAIYFDEYPEDIPSAAEDIIDDYLIIKNETTDYSFQITIAHPVVHPELTAVDNFIALVRPGEFFSIYSIADLMASKDRLDDDLHFQIVDFPLNGFPYPYYCTYDLEDLPSDGIVSGYHDRWSNVDNNVVSVPVQFKILYQDHCLTLPEDWMIVGAAQE